MSLESRSQVEVGSKLRNRAILEGPMSLEFLDHFRGPHDLIQCHMGAVWTQLGRSELWPNTQSTAMGPVTPATITNTTEVTEAPLALDGRG